VRWLRAQEAVLLLLRWLRHKPGGHGLGRRHGTGVHRLLLLLQQRRLRPRRRGEYARHGVGVVSPPRAEAEGDDHAVAGGLRLLRL